MQRQHEKQIKHQVDFPATPCGEPSRNRTATKSPSAAHSAEGSKRKRNSAAEERRQRQRGTQQQSRSDSEPQWGSRCCGAEGVSPAAQRGASPTKQKRAGGGRAPKQLAPRSGGCLKSAKPMHPRLQWRSHERRATTTPAGNAAAIAKR